MRIGMSLASLLFAAVVLIRSAPAECANEASWLAENAKQPGVVTLASGLQYTVLKSGPEDGAHPTLWARCAISYEGKLVDGTVFDSSAKHKKPVSVFSPARVIDGWREALLLMKPGDKWQLFVPSKLGYGSAGAGDRIPPDSTLIFELTLVAVRPADFLFRDVGSTGFQVWMVLLVIGFPPLACAFRRLHKSNLEGSKCGDKAELVPAMDSTSDASPPPSPPHSTS